VNLQLKLPLTICDDSDTPSQFEIYRRMTAGHRMSEAVGGPLHTPTRKANFNAPSMQKWPGCRNYVLAFGTRKPTPEQFEFLMGYPIGFTALKPSETP